MIIPSLEKHNMIFLWYHIDDKIPDTYDIGILNEINEQIDCYSMYGDQLFARWCFTK